MELLGVLLGFAGKLLLAYLQQRQGNQAMRDVGAASTAAKINQESADAERRAASVQPLDRGTAVDALDAGKF